MVAAAVVEDVQKDGVQVDTVQSEDVLEGTVAGGAEPEASSGDAEQAESCEAEGTEAVVATGTEEESQSNDQEPHQNGHNGSNAEADCKSHEWISDFICGWLLFGIAIQLQLQKSTAQRKGNLSAVKRTPTVRHRN